MVTTTVIALDRLPGWLAERGARLTSSLQPLFRQLQILAISDTRENFITQRDPDGSPWAPLKSRRGVALTDKGILRASVQSLVTANGLTLFTNVHYASAHQWGAMIPEIVAKKGKALRWFVGKKAVFAKRVKAHRIPQRRFLGFGQRFIAKVPGLANRYFDRLMGAA